jgi:hypothetical protein
MGMLDDFGRALQRKEQFMVSGVTPQNGKVIERLVKQAAFRRNLDVTFTHLGSRLLVTRHIPNDKIPVV